jgi:hypothetical protein
VNYELGTDLTQSASKIATANPNGSFGKASLCEKARGHEESKEILLNNITW